MDEIVQKFLRSTGPVLCVDIGSGTQDALLARPGLECENWPRFVLPAPARLVAQRIRELTLLKRNIWLSFALRSRAAQLQPLRSKDLCVLEPLIGGGDSASGFRPLRLRGQPATL